MKTRLWHFLLTSLLFSHVSAIASVVMPGDEPYFQVRRDDTLFIFNEASRESVEELATYVQVLRAGYDKSFNWRLDEELDLILTSPRQQEANAYATVMPNLKTVWYPSGAALLEYMAQPSWALALATHEISHTYQLNAKGPFPAALKKVVGNSPTFSVFWPFFIHPNVVTPTFLVEGNAVMNESRFNLGGRLQSGYARALVLAQIKAGDIDPNRLINNQFKFPYGENPYLQGGYFQAYVAGKYGVDKTNQFFLAQGNQYVWPLILNSTFREHFGASYPRLIREYVRTMELLAAKQVISEGKLLEKVQFVSPLNHDAEQIFYLTSNGDTLAKLVRYNKKSNSIETQQVDLALGKVFWNEGEPVVSTSMQHDLHHLEYSLYAEGAVFKPEFRGQIVNDIRAGKSVALDAGNTWFAPQVLVNGQKYDTASSQPILDEEGNVYYFRQDGLEHVAYKNREPLFRYDGFFGKALEVGPDGSFYFIGNTEYGASVFRFNKGAIARMLDSDRVIDARRVNDAQFLIVEITNKGREIKLADIKVNETSKPVRYIYKFETQELTSAPIAATQGVLREERSYNSLRDLRFSSMTLLARGSSSGGWDLGADLDFNDPMQFQNVTAGYTKYGSGDQYFTVGYLFTKYLPTFGFLYQNYADSWKQVNGKNRTSVDQDFQLMLNFPLLRWRHWDSSMRFLPIYSQDDQEHDPSSSIFTPNNEIHQNTYGLNSEFDLNYTQNASPNRSMYPLRSFELNYLNKLQSQSNEWRKKYNSNLLQSRFRQSFFEEFYATLAGAIAWAETRDVDIEFNPQPFNHHVAISRLTPHNQYSVYSAGMARVELAKTIDFQAYSPRIFIGINRFSPFVMAQGIFLDNRGSKFLKDTNYPANIFEWAYGADIDLLVWHLGGARLRLLNAYDTREPYKPNQETTLNYKMDF